MNRQSQYRRKSLTKTVSDRISSFLQHMSETRGDLDCKYRFHCVKVIFMFLHSYASYVWIFTAFFPALSSPRHRKTCLQVPLIISSLFSLKKFNNSLICSLYSTFKKTQKLTVGFQSSNKAQVRFLLLVKHATLSHSARPKFQRQMRCLSQLQLQD